MIENKNILIISPQNWGKMFVSKHHYAIALTRRGNQVFFLEPPDRKLNGKIYIRTVKDYPGLNIISHSLYFPYNLKFHALYLFHWLIRWHIRKIINRISTPLDIVWSFDLGNIYPFYFFPPSAVKIFHPVDEPLNPSAMHSAKGADVIFSVTKEILEKYKETGIPSFLVNHGVSDVFLNHSPKDGRNVKKLHVGFSGNLLRKDIDRPVLLQIIEENPEIEFEFWGSFQLQEANIGGDVDIDTNNFIDRLKNFRNVKLHGAVSSSQLSEEFGNMDAFLICYDVNKDQSKGTNYHKILEYVSTGKVTIANNITSYRDSGDLIAMIDDRNSNIGLPGLFTEVMKNIDYWNSGDLAMQRRELAKSNSYSSQLNKIDSFLVKVMCQIKDES